MKNWLIKHSNGVEIAMRFSLLVMLCTMCILAGIMLAATSYEFIPHPSIPVAYWVLWILWWFKLAGLIAFKKYSRKRNELKINTHTIAADIIDEFEILLDTQDITIPDKWREGGEDEARLYGETYNTLLESIESMVVPIIHTVANAEKIEIISGRF